MSARSNKLYYGDCLGVMKKHIDDKSMDLIYMDPPFNSNRTYNMFYKNRTGHPVPEQVTAFWDTWEWNTDKQYLMDNMHSVLAQYRNDLEDSFVDFWQHWMKALKNTNKRLLAYLMYMFVRLLEMKRILKPTGSLYYHCDPTASHYIKVILDGIFGHDNFRNEIIWKYGLGGSSKRSYSKKHDVILFYSKTANYTFNKPLEPATSMRMKGQMKGMTDVFDVPTLNNMSRERLGYPTQKPLELLHRFLNASCPKEGVVFDPFCGCGTTIYAAHLNNRRWMGCDITIHSTNLIQETLKERYQLESGRDYEVEGLPTSVESAEALMKQNPFEFEKWAVEYVRGFCTQQTNDKGIDGTIYFKAEGDELHKMVLSVKGGKHVNPQMVRDLRGVMDREQSQMAGLILLHEPTKGIEKEVAKYGLAAYNGSSYPKLQVLTVREMLEEKRLFRLPNQIWS